MSSSYHKTFLLTKENSIIPQMYFKFFGGKVYSIVITNFKVDITVDDIKLLTHPYSYGVQSSVSLYLRILRITYIPDGKVYEKGGRFSELSCHFNSIIRQLFLNKTTIGDEILIFSSSSCGKLIFNIPNVTWISPSVPSPSFEHGS